MKPMLYDAEAFLRARVVQLLQLPAHTAAVAAIWWRRENPLPGITWHLCTPDSERSGPAVVDDFGNLVLVKDVL
jgi:hypothetical protein